MSGEPAVERGRIRGYLLRNLAEADRARFEESYFNDDSLFDRIEAEEDLLVSDYVLGRLSDDDRHRFEQALLRTPYYRDRVETTARLRLRVARDEGVRRLARRGPAGAGVGLFPGRTGTVVGFALLTVLLLATFLTALRLKEQLANLRTEMNAAPPPAVTTAGGGVVPVTPAVVLGPPVEPGVAVRRVARAAGSPLVLVFPRVLAPVGSSTWRVVLRDAAGVVVWDSGDQPATEGASADLAVRLPPGVPEPGRTGVTLWSDSTPILSVLLEVVAAAPPAAR